MRVRNRIRRARARVFCTLTQLVADLARTLRSLLRDKASLLEGFDADAERLLYQLSAQLGPDAVNRKADDLLALMHRSLRAPVVRASSRVCIASLLTRFAEQSDAGRGARGAGVSVARAAQRAGHCGAAGRHRVVRGAAAGSVALVLRTGRAAARARPRVPHHVAAGRPFEQAQSQRYSDARAAVVALRCASDYVVDGLARRSRSPQNRRRWWRSMSCRRCWTCWPLRPAKWSAIKCAATSHSVRADRR